MPAVSRSAVYSPWEVGRNRTRPCTTEESRYVGGALLPGPAPSTVAVPTPGAPGVSPVRTLPGRSRRGLRARVQGYVEECHSPERPFSLGPTVALPQSRRPRVHPSVAPPPEVRAGTSFPRDYPAPHLVTGTHGRRSMY